MVKINGGGRIVRGMVGGMVLSAVLVDSLVLVFREIEVSESEVDVGVVDNVMERWRGTFEA